MKRFSFRKDWILPIILCSGIVPGSLQAQSFGFDQIDRHFFSPPNDFRLVHYWMNREMNSAALDEMLRYGIGGVQTSVPYKNYLQDEEAWAATVSFINMAKARDMQVWIHDERGYPSAAAGGLVVEGHPEYEVRGLIRVNKAGTGRNEVNLTLPDSIRFIRANLCGVVNGEPDLSTSRQVRITGNRVETMGLKGDWQLSAFGEKILDTDTQAQSTVKQFGQTGHYPSLLKKEACARFVELTHQNYADHIGDIGQKVDVFYTGEPNLMSTYWQYDGSSAAYPYVPWEETVSEAFRSMHGYDVLPLLDAMFEGNSDRAATVRLHYYQTIAELVAENYGGQISAWAKEHGVRSMGHPLLEEDIICHVAYYGDMIRFLREFHIAGCDLHMGRESNDHWIYWMGKYVGSAAFLDDKDTATIMGLLDPIIGHGRSDLTPEIPVLRRTANMNLLCGLNQFTSYMPYQSREDGYDADGYRRFNEYVGRIAMVLRGSTSEAPIAMYYPIKTYQSKYLATDQPWTRITREYRPLQDVVDDLATGILENGLDFNFVTDDVLLGSEVINGKLVVGTHRYSQLVMPKVEVIPLEVLKKILEIDAAGIRVHWVKGLPRMGAGIEEHEEVRAIASGLVPVDSPVPDLMQIRDHEFPVDFETSNGKLSMSRFRKDGRLIYFVVNDSKEDITLSARSANVTGLTLYNPVDGSIKEACLPLTEAIGGFESLLLVEKPAAGHAYIPDPTGMGMERVARLFTEVYQSPKAQNNNEIRWVQIDLGKSRNIDAVKLYPRVRVYDFVASEGFPEMFRIEASDDPEFKRVVQIVDKTRGFPDPEDRVCTFKVDKNLQGNLRKRYVRFTALRLRQQHLALTKMDVISNGVNIAEGCRVSDSENGDLGQHVLTRPPRPNGEGVVTDQPINVISEEQWEPVPYRARLPRGGIILKDALFKTTMENNIDYLMSTFTLEELTRNFRAKAGREVEPFNEALSRQWMYNLPGSEAGRFLMGAGNTLKWHEHAALRNRMNRIIEVIDECKEPDGYMMAYRKDDIFVAENGAYVRSWVTHGLLDAGYGGNEKAFELVRGYYDWFENCRYLPELLRRSGQGPQGIIPLTRTYFSPIGESRDIYTVQRYFQENYFMEGMTRRDPAIIWRYPYDRPHNYLLTAIEPYLDLYRATGDEKYLEAVRGGWELYKENWLHVGGSIAICEGTELYPPKSYYLTRHTGELCGSVFWIKLNQRFHLLYPEDEKYAGEMEKCIYNVGIANQRGVEGIRYFNRLVGQKDQVHGPYVQKMNSCCEGQGTRLYGSLPEYIYSLTDDGVYINLFAASSLKHKTHAGELQLEMETDFPYDNRVSITLTSGEALKSSLRLRIPSWASGNVIFRVNGKKTASGVPGTYLTLTRIWHPGDRISFDLPMDFRTTVYKGLEKGYDDGLHYIVEYGPLLMAAVSEKDPRREISLSLQECKLSKSLEPMEGRPLHFSLKGENEIVFRPYFELEDELFTCYPSFTE